MKPVKILATLAVAFILLLNIAPSMAQCSMCTINAESGVKNGNIQAKGLNNGVFLLLSAPYLAVAVGGWIWYKKYRRKNTDLNISVKEKDFHLN